MLVFSIDIGLVIMFFKVFEKIEIEVLYILYKKNNILAKNLHFNNISNVHHIETIEHFLTSEEDKLLHTQIPHYFLTKNAVACTTEVFMLDVSILPIFFLYHFNHIQFYKWNSFNE